MTLFVEAGRDKKLGVLTPGQGGQEVGMISLAEHFPNEVKPLWDMAGQIVGGTFIDIVKNGPKELLDETRYTQPAIVTHTLALWAISRTKGLYLNPEHVAGNSLGYITAATIAGWIEPERAIDFAAKRGEITHEVSGRNKARMIAFENLSPKLGVLLKEHGFVRLLQNTPTQSVHGALERDLKRFRIEDPVQWLESQDLGDTQVFPLAIGGPFHHPVMIEAVPEVAKLLPGLGVKKPAEGVKFYANSTGEALETVEQVEQEFLDHLHKPVLWADTMVNMRAAGAEALVIFDSSSRYVNMAVKTLGGQKERITQSVDGMRPRVMAQRWYLG